MDEVHSGTSVMSQSDLRLHFGLGKIESVDVIEVQWPTTQKIERFTQVKANQIITIREGTGIVKLAATLISRAALRFRFPIPIFHWRQGAPEQRGRRLLPSARPRSIAE